MEYKICPVCGADNPMWAKVCQYLRCQTLLKNNAMNNQLQINPPEGYEIDQDKSDLSKGIVYFKESKKVLSYLDVCGQLFTDDNFYFTTENGVIYTAMDSDSGKCHIVQGKHSNNSTTEAQLESILALNKLCNVAKYLNGDWLPKLGRTQHNWYIANSSNQIQIYQHSVMNEGNVFFKTKELAQQAIEILGEKEIRKALTLNH